MVLRKSSSPLSSATPSPRLAAFNADAGPSRQSSVLSVDDRNDRSRTSSTVALTVTAEDDDSELTEEDGGEEELGGEGEEEDKEEESEESRSGLMLKEEEGRLHSLSKRTSRVESRSISPTDSLTPPPPPEPVKTRQMLDVSPELSIPMDNAESGMEADDEELRMEEDDAGEEAELPEDEDGELGRELPLQAEEELELPVEQELEMELPDLAEERVLEAEVQASDLNALAEQNEESVPVEEAVFIDVEEVNGKPEAELELDEDAVDSPAFLPMRLAGHSHSSHAPLPTPAAMRNLLMLELKFAALRDRLYVKRMEEAAAEEEMILKGSHPAVIYLQKILMGRRERLHEVASRRHHETLAELVKAREAEKNHVWTWWTGERDRLHWDEFEQTWSKRRRLAREKNEIETPKIVKPIPRPRADRMRRALDWSEGSTPARLGLSEAVNDLAVMENRRPVQHSRHPSPVLFPQPALISQHPFAGSSTFPPQSDPSRHHHHRMHPNGAPARTGPTSYAQVFAPTPAEVAGLSRSGSGGLAQPQWREGRTVPTKSDMFKRDLVAREMKGDGIELAAGGALGAWAKQHDPNQRSTVGAMEARLANGYTNGMREKPPTPTPEMVVEKANGRFPGLSDYLGGMRDEISGLTGGVYQHMGKSASVFSPPKVTLGMSTGLGGRGLFTTSTANAQPTTTRPRS